MQRQNERRRGHLLTIGWLVALQVVATAHAQLVPPGIAFTATEVLAENLYAFRYGPYRSLFMVTRDGVIATDPQSPGAAAEYRRAIAAVTDLPVKFVVYSHAHWDHARGGQVFKDEGAIFVAQERCVQVWRESPHPDVVPPDITFSDEYRVELGGRSLDLYYFGPSHGTCLVVMIPRPHRMIYTVDLVTPRPAGGGYLPWDPQVVDFQFYNAVRSLEDIEALARREGLQQVIGAHLVPLPGGGGFAAAPATGPIVQIRERRQFWEGLMQAVQAEMARGTPSFLVADRLDLSPWEGLRGFQKRKFRILVDRVAAYCAIGR
jgi:glyoxylase-like metal-dependent hydrolase (beta-lactamase superfamily II)